MNENQEKGSPKTRRRERERQIRRDTIISIAEQAFIKTGYESITVEDIAQEVGYTKATIYNYFDSKEEVFTAVLAKNYERLLETLDTELNKAGAGDELRAMGEAYLSFTERYPGQAGLIDSGRCVLIHRTIIEKETTGQELTESEQELNDIDAMIEQLMTRMITQTMKQSGKRENPAPIEVIKVLSALTSVIQVIIRKGKSGGQSDAEIRETLSILFNIIEQGVKHYS